MLARHRAACQVLPPPFSYETSRARIYMLNRALTVKVSDVLGLDDELDDALTRYRGRQTITRFLTNPLAVVVPKQQPGLIPVRDMLRAVGRRDGLIVTLGEHYDHSSNPAKDGLRLPSWLRIDLSSPETPHMLVAGVSGSGKTGVMKCAALSLAVASSPATTAMLLIDIKAVNGFPGLGDLPHLAHPVISDPVEAANALGAVVEELFRRSAQAKAEPHRTFNWPRIVVFVDELAQTVDKGGEALRAHVEAITTLGRGVRIHFVGGTQKPSKQVLSPTIMANIPVRAVGSVATKEEGQWATGIAPTQLGAHKLTGRGDFILTINGNRMWGFQSPYIDPNDEQRIVQSIAAWWDGQRAGWRVGRAAQPAVRYDEAPLSFAAAPAPNFVAAQPSAGASKADIRARHTATILAIQDTHVRLGEWPSANRVCAMHKELHGVGLNPETAAKLLRRAQGGE